MAKMIGKKLYTFQTDDDDPITNKKSMKRREQAEWKKTLVIEVLDPADYEDFEDEVAEEDYEDFPPETTEEEYDAWAAANPGVWVTHTITLIENNPHGLSLYFSDPDDIDIKEADCE
jgi:hypothetical protein